MHRRVRMTTLRRGARMQRGLVLVFAALLLWLPQAVSALPVIDTFETPAVTQVFIGPSAPPAAGPTTGAGILGTRNMIGLAPLAIGDVLAIGGGTFQVFTGTSSLETSLIYSNFGTEDFSAPKLGILLDFLFLDGGVATTTADIHITLVTLAGTLENTVTVNESAVPFSVFLEFSSFTGVGSLSDVTTLDFKFNDGGSPQSGVDLVLDQLSVAVPQPPSIALLSVACAGLLYARRRIRKAPVTAPR